MHTSSRSMGGNHPPLPTTVAFCWTKRYEHDKPRGYPLVDWNSAPCNAHWWAMDASGMAHWFADPRLPSFDTSWRFEVSAAPDFGYRGDYRDSLTERPV